MSKSKLGANARDELTRRRDLKAAAPAAAVPSSGDVMASPEAVQTTSVVAEITRHPLNPRGEVTEGVDELAASIREMGILEPLVVASRAAFLEARPELAEQIPQPARWVLIAGERRLRAAAVAGLRTVPTVSGDHLMADRVDVEAMVVENVQREALTPVQEACAFQVLTQAGQSQRTIAKRVGRNQSHIARRLRLLRLPADALDAIQADKLSVKEAETLAGVPESLIPDVWEEFNRRPFGGQAADYAVQLITRQHEQQQRATATAEQIQAEGLDLITETRVPWSAQIQDDEVEEARAAGRLAGAVDTDGSLIYVDTEKAAKAAKQHEQAGSYEQRQHEQQRLRKQAMKGRREIAAGIAGKAPSATVLVDALVDYTIERSNFEERKLAAKWSGYDDGHGWVASLTGAPIGERRRAAWALAIAARENNASASYRGLTSTDAAYYDQLTAAGYEPTQYDRERLAAIPTTTEDNTDD